MNINRYPRSACVGSLGLLFILMAGLLGAEDYGQFYLRLSEKAHGELGQLKFRDVVDTKNTSDVLVEKYGNVPVVGEDRQGAVHTSHVLYALQRAGANLSKITVLSAANATVSANNPVSVIRMVREAIIEKVTELREVQQNGVMVEFTKIPENLPENDSFMSLSMDLHEKNLDLEESLIPVNFIGFMGEVMSTAEFGVSITVEENVVVAKRALMMGMFVSKDDFELVKTRYSGKKSRFHTLKALGSDRWQLLQSLEQGTPVGAADLRVLSRMTKGAIVTIVAGDKRFQVRSIGRVKEILDEGASIVVENLDSKKEVVGKPVGANEVEIIF